MALALAACAFVAEAVAADFTFAFGPGGGGQSVQAVSPFSANQVFSGTDTNTGSLSRDGGTTTQRLARGIVYGAARQPDGARWSRKVQGRLFLTAGNTTNGGVYVYDNLDNPTATPLCTKLDGQSTNPELKFAGNNVDAGGLGPPDSRYQSRSDPYPRHYSSEGGVIEIDEDSVAGYTLVHVCTVTDGVWTLKCRQNADGTWTTVRQKKWVGSGTYARAFRFKVSETNPASNDYSRCIVADYSYSAPKKLLLCTNANIDDGTAPTTAAINGTGSPDNIESIHYCKGSAAGAQPLAVFVKNGSVMFSQNAFTAAAGSITFTEATGTGNKPSNAIPPSWISCIVYEESVGGSNYVVLVGCWQPLGDDTNGYRSVHRGVVAVTSTTPTTSITWTPLQGTTYFSKQVMNQPGAQNTLYLADRSQPGIGNTSVVSGFAVSKANPQVVYMVCRTCSYKSVDGGVHWFPMNVMSSWCGWSIQFDPGIARAGTCFNTNVDFPATVNYDGFVSQSQRVVQDDPELDSVFTDPVNGQTFFGGTKNAGSPAQTSANNQIWSRTRTELTAGEVTSAVFMTRDHQWDTGAGSGATAVKGCAMGGIVLRYNNVSTNPRILLVAAWGGKGLHWSNDDGVTWQHFTGASNPFATANGTYRTAQFTWAKGDNAVYFYDRADGGVWRVKINSSNQITAPVKIFQQTVNGFPDEGVGYVSAHPTTSGQLMITTNTDAYVINSANTVAAATGTERATQINVFTGTGAPYSGEIAGPSAFLPNGTFVCLTMHFQNANTVVYPRNGAKGPRMLAVANPTSQSSWTSATDWCNDDSGGREFTLPYGISVSADGSQVVMMSPCGGAGLWNVNASPSGNVGPFTPQDIGSPGLAGSSSLSSGVYTVKGGGADIYGTADQFHFLNEAWNGDGRIVARVVSQSSSVPPINNFAKAGAMFRESTAAGAANVDLAVEPNPSLSGTIQLLQRTATNATSTQVARIDGKTMPYWVRLERHGNIFTGWHSLDGIAWLSTGSTTFTMASSALAGLAVSAHDNTALNTATFDNVAVTAVPTWTTADVGTVGAAGSTTIDYATDTFTVNGAGSNIWSTADSFHFCYQAVTGDVTIIAEVSSVENTSQFAKGGLMVRQSLADNDVNAVIDLKPGTGTSPGVEFLRRTTSGGSTAHSTGSPVASITPPRFLKLVRSGNNFSAYQSLDSATWTQVGVTETITMTGTIYVGLVSCSIINTTNLCTSTFESVYIK